MKNKTIIENVYFVTNFDHPTGEVSEKYSAHHADTKLHAAFSVYVFNEEGQLLVTQRAHSKKVWPGFWTNSCCGHPFPEESREKAIVRRLAYELGMTVKDIKLILPRYVYKTPPYKGIIEHEFCPVYVAIATSDVNPNPEEVVAHEWVGWQEYAKTLVQDSSDYSDPVSADAPKWSWWCKDQLAHLIDSQVFKEFISSFSLRK